VSEHINAESHALAFFAACALHAHGHHPHLYTYLPLSPWSHNLSTHKSVLLTFSSMTLQATSAVFPSTYFLEPMSAHLTWSGLQLWLQSARAISLVCTWTRE
jgi:hypothetical protein